MDFKKLSEMKTSDKLAKLDEYLEFLFKEIEQLKSDIEESFEDFDQRIISVENKVADSNTESEDWL